MTAVCPFATMVLGRRSMLRRALATQRIASLASHPDLARLVSPQPCLQAIEIEIYNRRGVQGKQLADREPADHRISERLT